MTSFKIEGRVKSSFYVATIVKAYREAIDAYYNGQPYDPKFGEEVAKVSNRDFTTGFFFKKPDAEDHNYGTSSYNRGFDFIGLVTGYDETNGLLLVEQRNRFSRGDAIEILSPEGPATELVVERLLDKEGNDIAHAPHAQMELKIPASHFPVGSILRKKSKN
ncbi:MAG: U32 family peptidase C-terminal domain-containing protein [Clostridia bacterium]|nr:U32 family peptidase C-terminal domain-containing protein [Clostridia bacterium]